MDLLIEAILSVFGERIAFRKTLPFVTTRDDLKKDVGDMLYKERGIIINDGEWSTALRNAERHRYIESVGRYIILLTTVGKNVAHANRLVPDFRCHGDVQAYIKEHKLRDNPQRMLFDFLCRCGRDGATLHDCARHITAEMKRLYPNHEGYGPRSPTFKRIVSALRGPGYAEDVRRGRIRATKICYYQRDYWQTLESIVVSCCCGCWTCYKQVTHVIAVCIQVVFALWLAIRIQQR